MYEADLIAAGLESEEAAVYSALIEGGGMPASALAKSVGNIKRTTIYKVIASLIEKGLAEQVDKDGVAVFIPKSPEILHDRLKAQVSDLEEKRQRIQSALPALKSKFLLTVERPIVSYKEGIDGLKEIYEDHIVTGKSLQFIRSNQARDYVHHFGKWWGHYLTRRAKKKIRTTAITPDSPEANHDVRLDRVRNVTRLWVRPEDYAAPVEIDIYGDKVAIISFGKEIFGIVIENEHVAQAFRDTFALAEKGAGTIDVGHNHE